MDFHNCSISSASQEENQKFYRGIYSDAIRCLYPTIPKKEIITLDPEGIDFDNREAEGRFFLIISDIDLAQLISRNHL